MLLQKRRIERKEFPRILSLGRRYTSPNLLAYILHDGEGVSKFSFSVSKKVCPKAVDRNKQRRRGYSIIGHHVHNVGPGYACFISFKKGSGKITHKKLEGEILGLLGSANVIS